MTKFAPYKAQDLIACDRLTFNERVVLHRVEWLCRDGSGGGEGSFGVRGLRFRFNHSGLGIGGHGSKGSGMRKKVLGVEG